MQKDVSTKNWWRYFSFPQLQNKHPHQVISNPATKSQPVIKYCSPKSGSLFWSGTSACRWYFLKHYRISWLFCVCVIVKCFTFIDLKKYSILKHLLVFQCSVLRKKLFSVSRSNKERIKILPELSANYWTIQCLSSLYRAQREDQFLVISEDI